MPVNGSRSATSVSSFWLTPTSPSMPGNACRSRSASRRGPPGAWGRPAPAGCTRAAAAWRRPPRRRPARRAAAASAGDRLSAQCGPRPLRQRGSRWMRVRGPARAQAGGEHERERRVGHRRRVDRAAHLAEHGSGARRARPSGNVTWSAKLVSARWRAISTPSGCARMRRNSSVATSNGELTLPVGPERAQHRLAAEERVQAAQQPDGGERRCGQVRAERAVAPVDEPRLVAGRAPAGPPSCTPRRRPARARARPARAAPRGTGPNRSIASASRT